VPLDSFSTKLSNLLQNEEELLPNSVDIDYKFLLIKYMRLIITRSEYDWLNGRPDYLHETEWNMLKKLAREVR
jgi:hypothetical protein